MEAHHPPISSDGKARKLKRKVIYVYETEDAGTGKDQSILATAGQTQMDNNRKKPPAISSDEYFNYNKKDKDGKP